MDELPRIRLCRFLVGAGVFCAGVVALQFVAHPASAESLREALVTAYTANPELDAERARQRATDEAVPQALSGARPTVAATGEIGSERTWSRSLTTPPAAPGIVRSTSTSDPGAISLSFSQPLFRGFRTYTGTASAEANVRAGRYALGNVEQNVLLNAVTAYVDVVRDQALVRLTQNNLDFLREELESTQARFQVGELTKTDVAQAESRVSGAVSEVSQAHANLARSRATYEQVIGRPPGTLSAPSSLNGRLPRSLTDAYKIGEAEHPALLSSRYSIEASDHDVDNIKGELLPTLTLDGDYTRSWNPSSTVLDTETSSIMGRLVVPLYQAGSVSSRVRQARQVSTQRRLESENIRTQIRAAISTAWDGLIATRAQITADRQQIRAAKIALDGVIQEQRVGQRTTLDVLDAQQELLTAQVELTRSSRNEVVAAFTLLASVGHLNARQLELPVAYYDDTAHYNKVRDKWWGLSVESPH